jgi:hypothetical protein
MPLKWFGVKVLVRTDAVGKPRARDTHLDVEGALVEERIVIVRAATGKRAAERAKRVAAKEARLRYTSVYGQDIRLRVLKSWQSYELFDPPSDGAEVFSETHRVTKTMSEREIAARFFPAKLDPAAQRRRATFIAAELTEAFRSPANPLQRTALARRRTAR